MRTCTRCGRELPDDEFYDVKYKDAPTNYKYTVCRTCTSIEQKRRYLLKTDPESPLLEKIDELYEKHAAAGRSVPGSPRRAGSKVEAAIDELLQQS